jgi:hypothetical protein
MPFVRFKVKEVKLTPDTVTSLKRFCGLVEKNIDAVKIVRAYQTVETINEPMLENTLLIIVRLPHGAEHHIHVWGAQTKEELAAFKPELVGETLAVRLDHQLTITGAEDNPLSRF